MALENTQVYKDSQGNRLVVGANGEIKIVSGGKITANGTQASHIADAKTDYAAGDLDTEAEIIAAFNATNAKINAILAALEGVGILASS
jgi:hypothetical protein